MGLVVTYKLIEINNTIATYSYGLDFDNFDGTFEVDVTKIKGEITKENESDMYLNLINPCNRENDTCSLLGRVFIKIFRFYQENGFYPEKGGHYF